MQLPREVIVGKGTLTSVTEVTKRLNLHGPALIIAGQKSNQVAGKKISTLLQQTGIQTETLLTKTITTQDIQTIEQKIKTQKPNIIIGIGGGTKIDAAKLTASNQNKPFISIPTTLSHDGIASPLASIKGTTKPYSIMTQAPLAIIADTNAINQAPWRSTISGCGDAIAKFTAVKDWKLAHKEKHEYYGEYAASLALMSAKLVMQNAKHIKPQNEHGTRVLLEALISCGVAMSIAGSSRPCSGAEHLFSHALDVVNGTHAMHGEQCGVGTILTAYLYKTNWKRIRNTLQQIGAPTTAIELGVKNQDIIEALQLATTIRPERYTILQKLQLDREACKKVAKETEVIS